MRYNAAESPVTALARRRDRDGTPFLSDELLAAAERLREDFELAQLGPRVTQNWERLLTGADDDPPRAGAGPASGPGGGAGPGGGGAEGTGAGPGRRGAALLLLPGRAGGGRAADGLVLALGQDRAPDRAAAAAAPLRCAPADSPAC